jgi:hypothetical protein
MASVTVDRVAAVQAGIRDTLLVTSPHSTLPPGEQDRRLAQSCSETCDLLRDWLDSGWFGERPPAGDDLLAETVPSPEQFARFLGPPFADTLAWLARCGIEVTPAQLELARAGVAELARRHRRVRRAELREVAEARVRTLARNVCQAAAQLRKISAAGTSAEPGGQVWRRRAQRVLKTAAAGLPSLALSVVLTAGPPQVEHSVSAWAHDAATEVVMLYHLAELAQPGARLFPPEAGVQAEAEVGEPEAEAGF